MASIPPHYTDRFILQRYNKALHFVQHLPATSNFQPTKSQKLEVHTHCIKERGKGRVVTKDIILIFHVHSSCMRSTSKFQRVISIHKDLDYLMSLAEQNGKQR